MSEYLVVDAIRDGGGIDSVRHEAICSAEAVGVARRLADQQERAEHDAGTTFLAEVDIVRGGRLVSWTLDGPLPHCGGCSKPAISFSAYAVRNDVLPKGEIGPNETKPLCDPRCDSASDRGDGIVCFELNRFVGYDGDVPNDCPLVAYEAPVE